MSNPAEDGVKAITAKIRLNTQDNVCVTEDIAHMCDLIDEQVTEE